MGSLSLGMVDVPLYPSLTSDSIEFILNNSESVGIVVSNKLQLNKVLKIRSKCRHLKFIIVMNEKDVPLGDASITHLKKCRKEAKYLSKAIPSF